jgi:hypothetical protein
MRSSHEAGQLLGVAAKLAELVRFYRRPKTFTGMSAKSIW